MIKMEELCLPQIAKTNMTFLEKTKTVLKDGNLFVVYCQKTKIRIMGITPPHIHTIDPSESEQYANDRIEFIPPYTRCNRIDDYKRAWDFFEDNIK